MLAAVIWALIYIAVAALVIYLIFWVLGQLGVPLPPMVPKVVWLIFGLLCILWIVTALLPHAGLPALPR